MNVHDLLLDTEEHKFYKKYKSFLEKTYDVQIFIPKVNSNSFADIIFGTIAGSEQGIESVKNFISKTVCRTMKSKDSKKPNDITIIILSDSEEECSVESEDDSNAADNLHSIAADCLHSSNCLEYTHESASVDSEPQTDSICIIENSKNDELFPSNTEVIQTSISQEDSIYVIESTIHTEISPKSEKDNTLVSSASLDDSVCIIDNSSYAQKVTAASSNSKRRNRSWYKMNRNFNQDQFIKVTQQAGVKDSGICEVSSTTEEPVLKRPRKKNGSTTSLTVKSNSPAPDYIALFQKCESGEKTSFAKYNPIHSVQKEQEDNGIIILDEPEISMIEKPLQVSKTVLPRRLRPIVIDGSNVARLHGNVSSTFSCKGIKLCVEFFLGRGHTEVTAFVPNFRRHGDRRKFCPTTDPEILESLAKAGKVVFTPSRKVNGQFYAAYDDRFIVELASKNGGVIVSNDNFKDLINENENFKEAIEKRLLMYCFAGDIFMVPDDPLGRAGPTLNEHLSFPFE